MNPQETSAPPAEPAHINQIAHALAAPFDPAEVKFKPQTVSGNRALAVAFVDARVVMDRLDDVLGVLGWQDSYECLPDGSVVCRLSIRAGGEWIAKMDVGGQSEQPDEGDRRKAAFSDALKRAAVKFGIGRYLYRSRPQWVDYDSQKRQFTGKLPQLPTPQAPRKAPAQPAAPTGPEPFVALVQRHEQALVKGDLCVEGDLVAHLKAELGRQYPGKIGTWPESARGALVAEVEQFASDCRTPCGAARAAELVAELEHKGRRLSELNLTLGRPQHTRPADWTMRDWRRAMAALADTPEPAAARKGA